MTDSKTFKLFIVKVSFEVA